MDFLNILVLILIACGAFTGLVIVTEITFNLFFIIKDRLMPFLTGEKRNRKKIMMPVMMSKEQKSDIPTYEELKHENDLLKKERLRMKAHMDRLHGIMDTLLAVKIQNMRPFTQQVTDIMKMLNIYLFIGSVKTCLFAESDV